LIKNYNFFIPSLYEGHPGSRRSLRPLKENIQHFTSLFSIFVGQIQIRIQPTKINADPSGSTTLKKLDFFLFFKEIGISVNLCGKLSPFFTHIKLNLHISPFPCPPYQSFTLVLPGLLFLLPPLLAVSSFQLSTLLSIFSSCPAHLI
jgi:hypothetical protein